MDLRVLGGYGSPGVYQRPSAFLINGRTLLDAGTVPGALAIPELIAIEHALISHAHLDAPWDSPSWPDPRPRRRATTSRPCPC
jgi:hypothetical protein